MQFRHGKEFALLLFTLLLKIALLKKICSCRSLKKSDHEQIALVALYKRVARANRSLTKSDVSELLVFESKSHFLSFALKNERLAQIFLLFSTYF